MDGQGGQTDGQTVISACKDASMLNYFWMILYSVQIFLESEKNPCIIKLGESIADQRTDQRTNRLRTSPPIDLEEQATNPLTTQRGDGQTEGRTSAFMEMRGHI